MTDLLEDAIRKARALPSERRDEIGHFLMSFMDDQRPVIQLTPEEAAELDKAEAEIARGEIASDEEVAEALTRFRL